MEITEKQIQEYLEKNLSLEVFERHFGFGGTAIIRLKLNGKVLGKSYAIMPEVKWERDRGHGGAAYVDSILLKVAPSVKADEEG